VASELIVPAVAEKVAEVAPEATVTEEGTVSWELLSEIAMEVAPDAAFVKVTVQTLEPPELRLVGEQEREERDADVARLMEAVLETLL